MEHAPALWAGDALGAMRNTKRAQWKRVLAEAADELEWAASVALSGPTELLDQAKALVMQALYAHRGRAEIARLVERAEKAVGEWIDRTPTSERSRAHVLRAYGHLTHALTLV